jgi:hypothetical protein
VFLPFMYSFGVWWYLIVVLVCFLDD